MKLPALLLALLLLCCPAHSFNVSRAVMQHGAYAVPLNQTFYVEEFTYGNTSGLAVTSNGSVYMLFLRGIPFLEDSPLTSDGDIRAALFAFYSSRGHSANITLGDVHEGIVSVAHSREPGEFKCRQITGTDSLPCNSFVTCRTACLGTPFCPNFANGGKPGEFIYALLDFEENSTLLGEAYAAEAAAYQSFAGSPTRENAQAYSDALAALNLAAARASASPLYYGYSYCRSPDYALPVLSNMLSTARNRLRLAEPFYYFNATSELVKSRTIAALEREATLPPPPIQAGVQGNSSSQANATGAAPPASQQGASSALYAAAGAGILALAGIAGVFIYLRGKKKKGL